MIGVIKNVAPIRTIREDVMNTKRCAVTRMGLVAIAASSALVLGACGGGGNEAPAQGQRGATAQGPQSPGNPSAAGNVNTCVTSDKVVGNPQDYAGKLVTVTGTVGQVVSQHAFTVTPSNSNRSNTQAVLTLDKDTMALTPGSPVQVEGMLQPTFDPNQAATYTGGNLGQGDFTLYNGRPYVQAGFAGPISANLTRENTSGFLKSGNCAALSDVLNNMQTYTRQQITVTGKVAQVIGPHAITVAPTGTNTGNNAQTLLAVVKDTGTLTTGSPVEFTGTLQPAFDINQATAFAGSNIDPTALAAYNGKPYAQAMYVGPVSANLAENQNGS
jgi:hypothetical protein